MSTFEELFAEWKAADALAQEREHGVRDAFMSYRRGKGPMPDLEAVVACKQERQRINALLEATMEAVRSETDNLCPVHRSPQ